jgi:membrane protein DedA with SNARE-associated domain
VAEGTSLLRTRTLTGTEGSNPSLSEFSPNLYALKIKYKELSMFDQFFDWVVPFVQQHGYWIVGLVLLVENMGIPVPGELILITAGLVAFEGKLDLEAIAVWAILGAIVGDNLGYLLGRRFGSGLLRLYSRTFRVTPERLEATQALFLRYSGWAVFLGRFVALLRIFAGPIAGVLGMSWRRFLVCNAFGAVLWVGAILGGSYVFGANVRSIVSTVGIWGIVICAGLMLYLKIRITRSILK